VSALDAGAAGDGRTDDTRALEQAIDHLGPGDTLRLPAGRTFAHGSVLHVDRPGITISGGGTLLATDEESSAVQVAANDVTLSGITVQTAHTTHRWTAPEQNGVWLDGGSNIVLADVTVIGSASAGVFVQGTQGFTITGITVRDTRADGIHMTAGAAHGLVKDVLTENTGDDGVAVVSYTDDNEQAQDIRIQSPHVHGNTNGRGVTVVGGKDVTISDVDVRHTAAAGIYIACERGTYQTRVPSNVVVDGGTVSGANWEKDVDHGAVLIYNGQGAEPLTSVTVQNIAISGTRASASRQVGLVAESGGAILGVTLTGLSFTGTGPDELLAIDTDHLQLRATGWTVDGRAVPDQNVDEG
jgi:polygalacturonase